MDFLYMIITWEFANVLLPLILGESSSPCHKIFSYTASTPTEHLDSIQLLAFSETENQ